MPALRVQIPQVLSGVRLRRLADHVEQWAHNLPEPKPLNARLTVEDVQIPPPIVDLPGLDDLGLNETSVSHLDGDVAAVKQHADLAHADHVSGLLEQAEAIGLLTAEDARQQDAGEILLGDALSDGRKATFKARLKGSIGEGPNHSNFSDQSSVRIQEILLNSSEILKNQGRSTFSTIFGEIPISFHQNLNKILINIIRT